MLFFRRRHPIRDAELSAFVDGELPAVDSARVEAHVESCDPCGQTLLELRAVRQSVRDLPRVAAPRSFALREADVQTEARAPAAGAFSGAPGLLGAVATMAVLVFGVLVAVDVGGTPSGGGADSAGMNFVTQGLEAEADATLPEALGDEDGNAPLPDAGERDMAGLIPDPNEEDGASQSSGTNRTADAGAYDHPESDDEAEDVADDTTNLDARLPSRDVADSDEAEADPLADGGVAEADPPADDSVPATETSIEAEDGGIAAIRLAEAAAAAVALAAAASLAFVWWRRRA